MNDELKLAIETLVDKHGLRMVAENLVEVCHDKAEHLRSNWQDKASAKIWSRVATKLGNTVHWVNLAWPS